MSLKLEAEKTRDFTIGYLQDCDDQICPKEIMEHSFVGPRECVEITGVVCLEREIACYSEMLYATCLQGETVTCLEGPSLLRFVLDQNNITINGLNFYLDLKIDTDEDANVVLTLSRELLDVFNLFSINFDIELNRGEILTQIFRINTLVEEFS